MFLKSKTKGSVLVFTAIITMVILTIYILSLAIIINNLKQSELNNKEIEREFNEEL